ncbi:MAG: hypothetical protein Kow00122_03780 [Thermoleophilia bacterium]
MSASDPTRLLIRPDQKVAEVLKEHPQLVDTFVAQSETFKRLQNPLMRKTFARLVTVAQAAEVANVPLARLLKALNTAAGHPLTDEEAEAAAGGPTVPPAGPATPPPGAGTPSLPDWLETAPVVAELDARDMQRRGEDPFFTIMDAARSVGLGQAFRLRNTFRPSPLLGVLEKKGFAAWAEQRGPEDWLITFFRERAVLAEVDADDAHPHGATRPEPPAGAHTATGPATAAVGAGAAAASADLSISAAQQPAAAAEALFAADTPPSEDAVAAVVRILPEDLTPPLPMQKVLEGLALLRPGELLLVHHLRTPPHLTAKLEQQGHRYRIWDLGPDRKDILIQKADV